MNKYLNHILIIADIEGSSGCWSYNASSFKTDEWSSACVEMSRDINAVARGLFDAGVKHVTVKDFHRTGYNLLPELIDTRARLISGYIQGPVPGIGNPGDANALMLIGMHAASGTDGFLAHTLTSRIERLEVNGKPMAEVELFSASLAPFGLPPIFFSGCPVACLQARSVISGISACSIDKSNGRDGFDADSWRRGLADSAVKSLNNVSTKPYAPPGPFNAVITLRDGDMAAEKLARRWSLDHNGNRIFLEASNIDELYNDLIRICYITPFIEKILPFGLFLYNLWGRFGLGWARRKQGSLIYDI